MFSDQENSKCGLLSCEFKSVISAQRMFRMIYKKHPPHRNNIQRWFKRINNTVSVKNKPDQEQLQTLVT